MSCDKSKFEKHQSVNADGELLIDNLQLMCPDFSKQSLKRVLQSGAVWLTRRKNTQRVRRGKRPLNAGDKIHLYYDEKIQAAEISPPELIADEGDYSVWCKPKGMFSQGTRWGDSNSICRWVESNAFPERPAFQVHRLDKATSGLMLVAHGKKVAAQLSALFEHRQVDKRYSALVTGQFSQVETIDENIDDKKAVTRVLQSRYLPATDQTQLLLKIETGRKHQIRRHLAGLGFPIVGDRLYGSRDNREPSNSENLGPDLQLESCYLSFSYPHAGDKKVYQL